MDSDDQVPYIHVNRLINEIDPDLNFSTATECLYYDIEQLKLCNSFINSSFSLLHANTRSVTKNLPSLLECLEDIYSSFSVIGLSETWLSPSNVELYDIPEYNHVSLVRSNRAGGGVSLHVKQSLVYKERHEFTTCDTNYECLFIEIISPLMSNIIIGVVYRPPAGDTREFINFMETTLSRIQYEQKETYIMGDFNLDITESVAHTDAVEFLDLMHTSSLFPLIDKPTRVTPNSSTLLDNIFSNGLSGTLKSGVLVTDVSDHYPVFASSSIRASECMDAKTITYRPFSESNRNAFREHILTLNWESVYECNDAQVAYDKFHSILSDVYNQHFPIKTRSATKSDLNPWLTQGIRRSIKHKNKLYVKYKYRPNYHNKMTYNRYKNILSRVITTAKKRYYQQLIIDNKNNPKRTWEILNEVMGRGGKSATSKLKLAEIDGHLTSDSREIAEGINKYFINVGSELESKIPTSNIDPCSYLRGDYIDSFYLSPTSPVEIFNCLNKLKNSSSGHDKLKPEIIKIISDHISLPLSFIFNMCFEQSIFPVDLKKANVTPIHKAGDPSIFSNYRPISVLPVFSKILERLLHSRLIKYFDEKEIISDSQFGFRKGYSTEIALSYSIDRITSELDNKKNVIGIFLDFKKAFDTVNHEILLRKLSHYGVRGNANQLLRSYLSQRTQSVILNQITSDSDSIDCGVPQGSILGPLLFIVYLNDFHNALTSSFPLMYADDTNIFISGKDIDALSNHCNSELTNINNYINSNRLSLNIGKTHAIVFSNNYETRRINPHIKINGNEIDTVTTTSFLGVKINNSLSWATHTAYIGGKIAKSIGIIKKASKILNQSTLISLYNSLVLPYLNYCNLIWGNAAACYLGRLFRLQKKVVRLVYGRPLCEHTAPYFTLGNLLNIFDIYKLNCSVFIFKLMYNRFPTFYNSKFYDQIFVYVSSALGTRNNNLLRIPRCRTVLRQKSLIYTSVKLFNDFLFPFGLLETSTSLKMFKIAVRGILIADYV